MSLLEKGMDAVRETITEAAYLRPEVVKANEALAAAMNSLELATGKFDRIEASVSELCAACIFAGFSLGVTEGLRAANEVRALLLGGREGGG